MLDLIDQFLRQGQAEGWRERTVEQYRKRLLALVTYLRERGGVRAADVRPADLDGYILWMQRRGTKEATRSAAAWTIRSFFRWLTQTGKVLSSPAHDIARPRDEELELPPPPLDEAEVGALLDGMPRRHVVDYRNRLHLELLYGCGLRASESITLNLPDLDLDRATVRVTGKGGKERVLPLPRGVMGALRDYLALRRSLLRGPDEGALLLSQRTGCRLDEGTFRNWMRGLNRARRGAKRVHPHLLRHSIAVHLLRGGADIRHVQEFLGHSSLETTKIYLRLVPGRLKEDYDNAMPEIAVAI